MDTHVCFVQSSVAHVESLHVVTGISRGGLKLIPTLFTALHGMQRGLNDEISVCLSVRLSVRPSVRQTRAL